jgi:hypothetical protein
MKSLDPEGHPLVCEPPRQIHDTSAESDLSLEHLQAELAHIDVLLRHEVRRWQLAGQDPADIFRGLYVSDDHAHALLARPFGASWGQTAALEGEERDAFDEGERRAALQARALAESARCQGKTVRLEKLATAFGLDRFEVDALLICLAPALDQRYERLYGYLQDDVTRKRPTVSLVLDLLSRPGAERLQALAYFGRGSPLFRYHLLHCSAEAGTAEPPLLMQSLGPDQAVVDWLLGHYQPTARLAGHAKLIWPEASEEQRLLAARADLAALVPPDGSVVIFYGPDRASQTAAAHCLAAEWKRPLLVVDLRAAADANLLPCDAVGLALRDGRLTDAVPYLVGWDACLEDDPNGSPPAALLAAVCEHPGTVVLAGEEMWQPRGLRRERRFVQLAFPIPAYSQRRLLWEHFVRQTEGAEGVEVSGLAGQFQLTSGQIRDAVASARDQTAQRGCVLSEEDLFAAARAHSNPRLSSLARKIVPRYGWQDIVLPEDQLALLREIVATVHGRPLVLDTWGVGNKLVSSRGITVLFTGPPGTGKTMAAEIMANELGLDLYKIDLSTVVSKYIGETEKNLERIFHEAERSNAILFFDEADALFGKRSEVRDSHDRYANIEISYLLQRMEAYDGVTILATNLRANLDDAFTRRLQFAVDFPFPEEADRLRIWRTLFPPDVPCEAAIDFPLLARRFRLAGGNIRNILVSAAYLAAADGQSVTMEHLLHGTRRELQKMGRLVGEEDLSI